MIVSLLLCSEHERQGVIVLNFPTPFLGTWKAKYDNGEVLEGRGDVVPGFMCKAPGCDKALTIWAHT